MRSAYEEQATKRDDLQQNRKKVNRALVQNGHTEVDVQNSQNSIMLCLSTEF